MRPEFGSGTAQAVFKETTRLLQNVSSVLSPAREARDLIRQVLAGTPGLEPKGISPHPVDWHLSKDQKNQLCGWIKRRQKGEPLAYILGWQPFFNHVFQVNDRVLVPRPETEELAQIIVRTIPVEPDWVVELGTGSGCLGLGLIASWNHTRLFASDVCSGALQVAKRNALSLQMDSRSWFWQGDLLQAAGQWPAGRGMLVANLPYVDPEDRENGRLAENVLAFEPEKALFPGGNTTVEGLFAKLFQQLKDLAFPEHIWLEIGDNQGDRLARLFHQICPGTHIQILEDATSRVRFLHVEGEGQG